MSPFWSYKHRFYVPSELQVGSNYQIPEDKARHIVQVLRLTIGAEFILFNGNGKEYLAKLIEAKKKSARVLITATEAVNRESNLSVDLIQGLSKGDRMDATIQKCVELGVSLIHPVSTARSNLRISENRKDKKYLHWQGVIISACEQSGRNVVPKLMEVGSLESVLRDYDKYTGLKLILHPVATNTLFNMNESPQKLVLLVGPEGGFTDDELDMAESHGFKAVSLGPRILRTETAAMAVISGIQAKWGDT